MLELYLAEKHHKEDSNSDTLNPQSAQSFSTLCYIEKTGGLLCHQTLAPDLLERSRLRGEQISGMQYSQSYLWDKPA
jgi:hypothetical protein